MIEEITKGIAKGLKTKFGKEYSIYIDSVSQGIKKPCFFILNTNCQYDRLLARRAKITFSYEIEIYLDKRTDRENILFELFSVLEFIDTDLGKLMGKNMSFSLENEKAVFKCQYTIIAEMTEEKSEYMEHLERKDV
jgi:hypothetical protein